ncbi:hypothetical protein BSI_18080 [Bacillus inaquosorum KCTC 13429]|uniref:Uncharacterized protein n=1 Tax=Bacillus inaquosorum KCTC 13429 TaxID=1236548 RepID=A0A9W5LIM9_9BACI|nr:hypothetical protein BSI_18080 [Bacillus inaquosorum KCTC 13429]
MKFTYLVSHLPQSFGSGTQFFCKKAKTATKMVADKNGKLKELHTIQMVK